VPDGAAFARSPTRLMSVAAGQDRRPPVIRGSTGALLVSDGVPAETFALPRVGGPGDAT